MKSAIGENPKGPKGPKGPQQTLILQKPEWALDLAGLDHPDSLEQEQENNLALEALTGLADLFGMDSNRA